jgi:hypothetical protein
LYPASYLLTVARSVTCFMVPDIGASANSAHRYWALVLPGGM